MGLIYFLVFLIPCYFLFVYNNKQIKILSMFNDDGKPQKKIYNLIVILCGIMFFLLLLIVMYLFDPFKDSKL